MRKLSRIMLILGILLFITGNFSSKNSDLLPFLIGCPTGLKPELK